MDDIVYGWSLEQSLKTGHLRQFLCFGVECPWLNNLMRVLLRVLFFVHHLFYLFWVAQRHFSWTIFKFRGVIHKPYGQIFGNFWPSPLYLWTILFNKAYVVIWASGKPPSPQPCPHGLWMARSSKDENATKVFTQKHFSKLCTKRESLLLLYCSFFLPLFWLPLTTKSGTSGASQ